MTADEIAFIEQIRERPADDAVRLVYADWLEEHGGRPERAALIRSQIQQPWLAPDPWHRLFGQTRLGLPTVISHCHFDMSSFVLGARPFFADPTGEVLCLRGLVHAVRLPCDAWLTHAAVILEAHPVECVELTDKRPYEFPIPPDHRSVPGVWNWSWASEGPHRHPAARPEPGILPQPIYDRLAAGKRRQWGMYYDTEAAALDDASLACLAYGLAELKARRAGKREPVGADTGRRFAALAVARAPGAFLPRALPVAEPAPEILHE